MPQAHHIKTICCVVYLLGMLCSSMPCPIPSEPLVMHSLSVFICISTGDCTLGTFHCEYKQYQSQ